MISTPPCCFSKLLPTALLLLSTFALNAQTIEFGNVNVVQNDSGTTASSVTLTKGPGSTNNFSILGGNRGDYDVSFGSANDAANGVMITSVSQNGRDNTAAGDTIGLFYASSASDYVGSGFANKYWIPVFRTAQGDEVNINVACAWFPYNTWLGGFVRNATGTNGGANNTLAASPGITLGTHFIDGATTGISTVNLTSLSASSANGVLLVNHAKNEDNYAASRANADGSFTVWTHDNGTNGGSYEQDPVAFVYIPSSAVGTNQLVAMGRVNSGATTDISAGNFTLTKGGVGQWYLSIPDQNNTTGVLIISPEGGGTNTADNVVSYQWDVTNSRWVIESRDLSGATVQPTLQDGASAGEDMFSFAFFATPNMAPVASISAPVIESYIGPATFTLEATASDADGSITQVEFLRNGVVVGTDNTAPFTLTESGLTNGAYNYIARATDDLGGTGSSAVKVINVTFDPNNIPANTAIAFDGANDYVTMGPAPELNVGGPPPITGFTLECWFRKDGTGRTAGSGSGGVTAVPLFGKGRGESDGGNIDCNIFFGITTGGILVGDFESMATGLNHPITATNTPISTGTWYHAAATFDGTTGVWKMYLDGVEVGSATISVAGAVPRYDSIQHFGLGAAFNSTGVSEGAFAGVIDEARVWSYARSAAEIAAAKDFELGSGAGLIGRFGLNEGYGVSAASSTGATVGTLTNNPAWVPGAPFATANTSPTVSLTAPMNNATSFMPYPVSFSADASDVSGSVAKVEFRVDGVKVGEDVAAPYTFSWTPPATGTYAITARAIDDLGASTVSAAASLIIQPNPNQPPVVTLNTPADAATISGSSVNLQVGLSDPNDDAMTVTFYGRPTAPATPAPDFTLVAIPDTQYYSEGSAARANTVTVEQLVGTFGAQTQWVVDNRVTRNVAFVSHMGDIVENGNFGGNPIQWQRASAAMGRLENPLTTLLAHGIPYGLAPGNHDIDPIGAYDTGSTSFFNQYFNVSRFAGRSYYGGNYGTDNTNNFNLFSAGGLDFISIHMSYDTTPNQDILDWADGLLKAHPHRRAIVTSHWIIGQGNPATFSTQGAAIYNNLKDNPNLFLLLCGHIHAEGRRSDTFEGRTVYSVLSDYQGLQNGGNGFLRTFTFSPANNRIRVESWSPTLNRAAALSDGLPHFDGTYDLTYNMQAPVSGWVPLGTANVAAGGTSASLNWTGLESGKDYEWYATASDSINLTTSATRRFSTAPGVAPSVTLDTPSTGAIFSSPATINFAATAADTDGTITRVEFYNSGNKIGEDTTAPYEFTWNAVPAGSYNVNAVAVDNSGLVALSNVASITVNLGDMLPVVSITAPVTGSVLEAPVDVTITADAMDNEAPVVKVEFFSGTITPVLLGEDTTAPFSLPLTAVGPGTYTYTARATDSVGQTTTSAAVTISVFTEAPTPNPANISIGTFDLPGWTVAQTSPSPRQFDLPGTDIGDLELKINGVSVPFASGITLANNWGGPMSTGNSSNDNICQPYSNGSGNVFVSVLDNTNNNAPGANPGTSEQSSGVSVAFLPYASGFTGASVNSSAGIIAGNLPAGVTITKSGGAGTYTVNGLSTAGNMLAFTNGDTGTLADNVCSVRIVGGNWVIDTRDNAGGTQDNEFTFVYLPPAAPGVYAGKVSSTGAVTSTNNAATTLGVTPALGVDGVDLTFGDGSVINPSTAAIFITADATNGAAASTAVDNLIAWSASGNSFRIFTQDLEGVDGTHENIDLRFVAIPYVSASNLPEVTITATDATAGEHGADQTLSFSISRTGDTTASLTVPLAASGTATSGADYSGFLSSFTIPAGQASASLPLTVLTDTFAEGSETIIVSIGSGSGHVVGSPASANASIADTPAQNWFAQNIADPMKRGASDDADDDGVPNVVEYFMGTLPGDGGSVAATTAQVTANTAIFRFNRALNRAGVTGVVEWSANLRDWFRSGQNNGVITVNIAESSTSASTDDPQIIDATASNAAGPLPALLFFRLAVSE
jgi:hypothetical protein